LSSSLSSQTLSYLDGHLKNLSQIEIYALKIIIIITIIKINRKKAFTPLFHTLFFLFSFKEKRKKKKRACCFFFFIASKRVRQWFFERQRIPFTSWARMREGNKIDNDNDNDNDAPFTQQQGKRQWQSVTKNNNKIIRAVSLCIVVPPPEKHLFFFCMWQKTFLFLVQQQNKKKNILLF
jgi:hypothetical protein